MSERENDPKLYRPRSKAPGRTTIQQSEEKFIERLLASKRRIAELEGRDWDAKAEELYARRKRHETLQARIRNWKPEMGPMGHTESFLAYYIVGKGLQIGGGW